MASNKAITDKQAHLRIGQLGESLACAYLNQKGFAVQERNYRKKYGEIDIVAMKGSRLHFIEVKSVSCETIYGSVAHGTGKGAGKYGDSYNPADNVHPWKLKRLMRTIEAYLLERYKDTEPEWQLDVLCVYVSDKDRKARVVVLEDIDL